LFQKQEKGDTTTSYSKKATFPMIKTKEKTPEEVKKGK
jgi:hypothetical protein